MRTLGRLKTAAATIGVVAATSFALTFLPLSSGLAQQACPLSKKTPHAVQNQPDVLAKLGIPKKILRKVTGGKKQVTAADTIVTKKIRDMRFLFFQHGFVVVNPNQGKATQYLFQVMKDEVKSALIDEINLSYGEIYLVITGKMGSRTEYAVKLGADGTCKITYGGLRL